MFCSNCFISISKYSLPPTSRIYFVEKLECMPEPFQSVSPSGLQCHSISTSYVSHSRIIRYRAIHIWSAAVREPLPKIWNSHWPFATSALMPSWLMPAARHRSRCSSTILRGDVADVVVADSGVIRALRRGIPAGRETERPAVLIEEIFLLETEPRVGIVENGRALV